MIIKRLSTTVEKLQAQLNQALADNEKLKEDTPEQEKI
jgi:hypothetical protein